MRWFWLLHVIFCKPADSGLDDRASTSEEAKAQFETAWRQWLGVGEAA